MRANTILARKMHILRFARALGINPDDTLLAVTRADLEAWQDSITHLAPNSRSSAVAHVRCFFAWALKAELIDKDPALVLASVRTPQGVPRPISEDDLQMAISCAMPRIRAMLVLAAFEGLRACEIAALTRQAVCDTAEPPVLLVEGKGGKQRVVPLSERTIMELRSFGMPSRGFIFPRLDGRPGGLPANRISQICNQYLAGLAIPASLHCLRHRFGTMAHRASKDLRVTQSLMGHADPATTVLYIAWSSESAVAAVQGLPGASLASSA